MRKTALLSLAALAAGALTASAQNVYSLNIVGYVNVPVQPFNNLIANPLDNGAGNSASAILNLAPLNDNDWNGSPPAGTLDQITVLWFNGTSFQNAYYEADYTYNVYGPGGGQPNGPTNGWATDANGTQAVAAPTFPPGMGFGLANPGAAMTNTFVGTVAPAPGVTNGPTILPFNNLVASMLPVSGTIGAAIQFPLAPLNDNDWSGSPPAGTLDQITVTWFNGTSYQSAYYEADYTYNVYGPGGGQPNGPTNGWATDANGTQAVAAPTINVGQGFFLANPGASVTWSQHL